MLIVALFGLFLTLNAQLCALDNECGPFPMPLGGVVENRYPGSPLSFWMDIEEANNQSLAVTWNLGFDREQTVCVAVNAADLAFSECRTGQSGNLTVAWVKPLAPSVAVGRVMFNLWCQDATKCVSGFAYRLHAGLVRNTLVAADGVWRAPKQTRFSSSHVAAQGNCCNGLGGTYPSPCCSWGSCGMGIPRCGPNYPSCQICCPSTKAASCRNAAAGLSPICHCI